MKKIEIRCLKCRKNVEIEEYEIITMKKTGNKAIKGKCPICSTTVFRILGKSLIDDNKQNGG